MHSAWARTSSAKQSHRSVTSYVEIDITPLESLLKSSVKEAAPSANAADTSAVPRGKARDAPDFCANQYYPSVPPHIYENQRRITHGFT